MDSKKEKSFFTRRNFITKLGIFLAGGPPLPWKWVKLDPMEAGRRAFRAYLEHKG